ncbi:MAG TPA: lasso peptide biosynthesis B2 protein [Sphingomonadaceae bacterium]|jgi:hypothetical protein|nr:lasso peptide biosynthesis B2 protein [Sphingomonadaceae bacterium]
MAALTTPLRRRPLAARDWRLLMESAFFLSAASLAIAFVPFRRLARWLSEPGKPRAELPQEAVLDAVQAVNGWARRMPWKTVCFQKGLTVQWMLRRRGIDSRLHYGVDHSAEHGLRAHVWVSVNGEIVIGGDVAHEFTCLATFPAQSASATR